MAETGHTPGPWESAPVIRGVRHPGEIRNCNGPVAYLSLCVPTGQWNETRDLIASAPDLLAGLEKAQAKLCLYICNHSIARPLDHRGHAVTCHELQAVIAKAKGEETNG